MTLQDALISVLKRHALPAKRKPRVNPLPLATSSALNILMNVQATIGNTTLPPHTQFLSRWYLLT